MSQSFDYTTSSNPDTLQAYTTYNYRIMHWLADILRNWMSDPVNLKDERQNKLLNVQDEGGDSLDALFDIGTPYSPDTRKACTTPMILISLGETTYPVANMKLVSPTPITSSGSIQAYNGVKMKTTALTVGVYTESYDGTVLLAGQLEEFLCTNEVLLTEDCGCISSFTVLGVSAPNYIKQGTEAHAKPVYQMNISIQVRGSFVWTADTQGPVFRGIRRSDVIE